MLIRSKRMNFKNFKAIKELECEFGDEITIIKGGNGTGKSTIVDGFMWVLFGKDSHGRSDFAVQTLDSNNNVIHGLEHSVALIIDVDGREKTFKRTLKERWVKPNGKAEKELKGCTTEYEIDEIPVKQKEYQSAINEMIEENIFKMVTNPLYFSNLNWSKQREILLDIIGDISDENVINYNSDLKPLETLLTDGIDNFNKRTKASIAKLKEQVKSIPYRIDECNNSIVEVNSEEFELKKINIQENINHIEEQIADSSKANEEKLKLQDELYKVKEQLSKKTVEAHKIAVQPLMEVQNKFNDVRNKVQEVAWNIKDSESKKDRISTYIESMEKDLETQKGKKQELLKEYHSVEDKEFEFDDTLASCPHCGREYDLGKIEEIKANAQEQFNTQKSNALKNIVSKGKTLAADIQILSEKIKTSQKDLDEMKNKIVELEGKKLILDADLDELGYQKQKLDCTEEIKFDGEEELKAQINQIQAQIEQFNSSDNTELKSQKKALQNELDAINTTLGKKDVNEDLKKRMEELNQEEKQLQIKIAELEGQQFLGEEFIRTKVELLEDSINKKFKGIVTFKLFENQVNGGLKETCEALIEGVPFSSANTASQINAGLSILNTLCEHYGINAPVFIDNAESVNEIIHTDSQLIKLIVSLDENLKVEVDK